MDWIIFPDYSPVSGGGRIFLNHSNIEDVLNKWQPGDYPRKTKHGLNLWMCLILLCQYYGLSCQVILEILSCMNQCNDQLFINNNQIYVEDWIYSNWRIFNAKWLRSRASEACSLSLKVRALNAHALAPYIGHMVLSRLVKVNRCRARPLIVIGGLLISCRIYGCRRARIFISASENPKQAKLVLSVRLFTTNMSI